MVPKPIGVLEQEIADTFVDTLVEYSNNRPRTHQGRSGYIGPSDLGFCRQKALLTMKQVEATDVTEGEIGMWPADVGSALHEWVDEAFDMFGDGWVRGAEHGRVTATFPESNAQVSGTFDMVKPSWNLLVDVKTVDGFGWVKHKGPSQNYLFQAVAYALGCIADGLLVEEGLRIAWVFLDRSGKEKRPYVLCIDYDPTVVFQVDQWISDVIYARQHDEDASRDIPAERCEAMCRFFTVCRGVMEDSHDPVLIDDPEQADAARTYLEARKAKDEASRLMDAAKQQLQGVSGATEDGVQVRWVHVSRGTVPAYDRAEYDKLTVRQMRRKQ